MKAWMVFLIAAVSCAAPPGLFAEQISAEDRAALRAQIERRYDVVLITNGVALRPKTRSNDVRLIEVSDEVLVNGTPVSGRELAARVGADADAILRLTYLDANARRTLFENAEATTTSAPERPPEAAPEPVEPESRRRMQRSNGDRIRILDDIHVDENEEIAGQVVAVIGDVRIDGEVGDQVVAVLGSVELGPHAVVRGDIVTVGGRLRRASGAQVRGGVTEVALGRRLWVNLPWFGPWQPLLSDRFGATARLLGTAFRLVLLALIASIALVVARPSVEGAARRVADNPVKATLVGFAAWVVFVPVFTLTVFVLAVSIIGIPLLVLAPFAILLLVLMAIAGFSGTAYAIGQWARRRLAVGTVSPLVDVWIGIFVIVLPVLLGRVAAV
jgi:hypothetical protein